MMTAQVVDMVIAGLFEESFWIVEHLYGLLKRIVLIRPGRFEEPLHRLAGIVDEMGDPNVVEEVTVDHIAEEK
jgi:hypothetical protein